MVWIVPILAPWIRAREAPDPAQATRTPSHWALTVDPIWAAASARLVQDDERKWKELREALSAENARLPQPPPLPEVTETDIRAVGTYGQLPEIMFDQDPGYDFPTPLRAPETTSWALVALESALLNRVLSGFSGELETFKAQSLAARQAGYESLSERFLAVHEDFARLAREVRYLETWIAPLREQWLAARRDGALPATYRWARLFSGEQNSEAAFARLAEELSPHRVRHPAYLPAKITPGVPIVLTLYTDVTDSRFRREMRGAIDTYWNGSSWARERGLILDVSFRTLPTDADFAAGRTDLDQHLARFPRDQAVLTTGGLSTFVRGRALVLGPGKTRPRTLAHEFGHLLGFEDCYFRTLGEAAGGWLGLQLLEWSNPLYPDELMCDNTVGAPRVLTW